MFKIGHFVGGCLMTALLLLLMYLPQLWGMTEAP